MMEYNDLDVGEMYCGWANYETWLVSVWLGDPTNDFDLFEAEAPSDIRDIVENFIDFQANGSVFVRDLMYYVSKRVDWRELYLYFCCRPQQPAEDKEGEGGH